MNMRINYLIAGFFLCSFLASLSGCSHNNENGDHPLTIPDMRDGKLTLFYPEPSISSTYIQGGIPPYQVSCESDILKVSINKESPDYFRHEVTDIGNTTVTVSDAAGNTIRIPVVIEYSNLFLKITTREVKVIGDHLTNAQHEELQERALNRIPVQEEGGYRLVYTAKNSGTLYIHKTAMDSYRYEGTFTKTEPNGESTLAGYEFRIEDTTHAFYWAIYSGPLTRAELAPRYALYEDLTELFLPEYPELESLVTIQVPKY